MLLHGLWQRTCQETEGQSHSGLCRQKGVSKEDIARGEDNIDMLCVRC